jgi:hypothetical protein
MAFNPNASMLAGVDTATLQTWLSSAQNAYQQLMTGMKVVSASYDGKSTSFTQTDAAQLMNWISLLQRQLGIGGRRGALRPYFR